MTREIKFRAWVKEKKKMSTSFAEITFSPKHKSGVLVYFPVFDKEGKKRGDGGGKMSFEDIELMQYTNLKDKNGKEIYEGDIVSQYLSTSEDDNVLYYGCVKYMAPEFCLKIKDKSYCVILRDTGHNLEIIGNIYENPELLTK